MIKIKTVGIGKPYICVWQKDCQKKHQRFDNNWINKTNEMKIRWVYTEFAFVYAGCLIQRLLTVFICSLSLIYVYKLQSLIARKNNNNCLSVLLSEKLGRFFFELFPYNREIFLFYFSVVSHVNFVGNEIVTSRRFIDFE